MMSRMPRLCGGLVLARIHQHFWFSIILLLLSMRPKGLVVA